jgi:lysophospholipase
VKHRRSLITASLLAILACSSPCHAIKEQHFESTYQNSILPFLNSGKHLSFESADGKYKLSSVLFLHPQTQGEKQKIEKGLIVIVNGRTESWLKYGELFHDLYTKGYDLISYDHRGQGLSPHLVSWHHQIGHVEHFSEYAEDLNKFMETVVKPIHPDSKNLFLIANSMGGAVAAEYLEQHGNPPPFQAVVLCAPMLKINTKPYPEWFAQLLVGTLTAIGFGEHYAVGQHDSSLAAPFDHNPVTGSRDRWWSYGMAVILHPEIKLGGPSNAWVATSLSETKRVRKDLPRITCPVMIMEAGRDEFVLNKPLTKAVSEMPNARLIIFPDSLHGILVESDSIRNKAMQAIERFFR